jgi:hypothetical protein
VINRMKLIRTKINRGRKALISQDKTFLMSYIDLIIPDEMILRDYINRIVA